MCIRDRYIEGEPYISTVPIDPGMTNTKERKEESIKETEIPEQVIGLNTENSEINEGMIRLSLIHIFIKTATTEQMGWILFFFFRLYEIYKSVFFDYTCMMFFCIVINSNQ